MLTAGEQLKKARLIRTIWEAKHPGVHFSLATPNPLAVKRAKKLGVPGVGLPLAIMNWNTPHNPEAVQRVKEAALAVIAKSDTPYVTFTSLAVLLDWDFEAIFGALNFMRAENPYSVRFTVNRSNDCVCVRIIGPGFPKIGLV